MEIGDEKIKIKVNFSEVQMKLYSNWKLEKKVPVLWNFYQ